MSFTFLEHGEAKGNESLEAEEDVSHESNHFDQLNILRESLLPRTVTQIYYTHMQILCKYLCLFCQFLGMSPRGITSCSSHSTWNKQTSQSRA